MKGVIASFFVICVVAVTAELQCQHPKPNIPTDWIDIKSPCTEEMRRQIQEEIKAAMQYMAMGAHFAKDNVNRLGFSKLFFEAASEEREHAIKLIEYLLMRGELTSRVSDLIKRSITPETTVWSSGLSALKDALNLEAKVTRSIRQVIQVCENALDWNDYHLVDYLTGVYLEEQYKGQRELAGRISTLEKMNDKHGDLGEYLYDKKLLN